MAGRSLVLPRRRPKWLTTTTPEAETQLVASASTTPAVRTRELDEAAAAARALAKAIAEEDEDLAPSNYLPRASRGPRLTLSSSLAENPRVSAAYAWGWRDGCRLGIDADGVADACLRSPTASTEASAMRPEPVLAFGPLELASCAAGLRHSLFLSKDGRVYACGANERRQLGRRGPLPRPAPVMVSGLDPSFDDRKYEGSHVIVGAVHCMDAASFALTRDGKLFSWGSGTRNACGHAAPDDPAEADSEVPRLVMNRSLGKQGVKLLACGAAHALVLTGLGRMYAWGDNRDGQCGVGRVSEEAEKFRAVRGCRRRVILPAPLTTPLPPPGPVPKGRPPDRRLRRAVPLGGARRGRAGGRAPGAVHLRVGQGQGRPPRRRGLPQPRHPAGVHGLDAVPPQAPSTSAHLPHAHHPRSLTPPPSSHSPHSHRSPPTRSPAAAPTPSPCVGSGTAR